MKNFKQFLAKQKFNVNYSNLTELQKTEVENSFYLQMQYANL